MQARHALIAVLVLVSAVSCQNPTNSSDDGSSSGSSSSEKASMSFSETEAEVRYGQYGTRYDVELEIENTGDAPAENATAEILVFDLGSYLVTTDDRSLGEIAPGETVIFSDSGYPSNYNSRIWSYDIEVTFDDPSANGRAETYSGGFAQL